MTAEVISFYAIAPSQGKRTLSLAFSKVLAEYGHKVLYIELDAEHPSLAASMKINDSTRNVREYFQEAVLKQQFDVEPFVLNKASILESVERKYKGIWSDFPEKLHLLIFPDPFEKSSFPTIIKDQKNAETEGLEFISKFIYALKSTRYDYVILNLPNSLHSIFGYLAILQSDKIVNVITPSASRLMEYHKAKKFINNNADLSEKWKNVMNMVTEGDISESEYFQLLHDEDNPILIPFDPERQKAELALEIGSELINEKMAELAYDMYISVELPQVKKKKGFFVRG